MDVKVHEIGAARSKIVVADAFLPNPEGAVDAAVKVPEFPPEGTTAYPGRRHQIAPGDEASAHVVDILRTADPLIRSHFGADIFRVLEASFSLVTLPPRDMTAVQRTPHYDWADANYLAILLHLHHLPGTGTAFYRHRKSGLERVDEGAAMGFRQITAAELAEPDAPGAPPEDRAACYYDKIFDVEARFNRLVIYQGCLIHSAYFPPGFDYSSDPRTGRLTMNVFIQTAGRCG
jgi:hypothetical protein